MRHHQLHDHKSTQNSGVSSKDLTLSFVKQCQVCRPREGRTLTQSAAVATPNIYIRWHRRACSAFASVSPSAFFPDPRNRWCGRRYEFRSSASRLRAGWSDINRVLIAFLPPVDILIGSFVDFFTLSWAGNEAEVCGQTIKNPAYYVDELQKKQLHHKRDATSSIIESNISSKKAPCFSSPHWRAFYGGSRLHHVCGDQ